MITMHDIAISSLITQHPTLETRRFMHAVRIALGVDRSAFESGGSEIRIRPDAYKIHQDEEVIVCFEVEYGHPVSTKTMSNYSELWWALNEFHWELALVVVDKWGECLRGIDVGDYALRKLATENPPKPPHLRDPEWVRFAAEYRIDGKLLRDI